MINKSSLQRWTSPLLRTDGHCPVLQLLFVGCQLVAVRHLGKRSKIVAPFAINSCGGHQPTCLSMIVFLCLLTVRDNIHIASNRNRNFSTSRVANSNATGLGFRGLPRRLQ